MSYEVLAQKWRPKSFSDVVGQQHITTTLKNQILKDRVGHAYLFWGPRGTGKTSIARLLAKTINCLNIQDAESCNNCKNCRDVIEDRSLDVIEIDAASNRGIDSIRDLKENAQLVASELKYKIYIIDEVHMLTKEAFNALLKTLEEPPPNIIFILATTEYTKLPATIVSRCQDFEFHYIASDKVIARMRLIAERENIELEDDVLMLLNKQSDGCLRDAQNLLERLISVAGKQLTLEQAQSILGVSSFALLKKLVTSFLEQNLDESLVLLNQLNKQGLDLLQCLQDLIDYFRKLRLFTINKNTTELLELTTVELDSLKEQSDILHFSILSKIIKILIKTTNDIKLYGYPLVQFETAVIEIYSIADRNEINLKQALSRLEYLEHNLDILRSDRKDTNLSEPNISPKKLEEPVKITPKPSSSYKKPVQQVKRQAAPKQRKQSFVNTKNETKHASRNDNEVMQDEAIRNALTMFNAEVIEVIK